MRYELYMAKKDDIYLATVPELNKVSSSGLTRAEAIENVTRSANAYMETIDQIPPESVFEINIVVAESTLNTKVTLIDHLYYDTRDGTVVALPQTEEDSLNPEFNLPGDVPCKDCPDD